MTVEHTVVRKVFRPPYIFHSLLYCSHLLKSFKFIFFLINVHTAPHIDRKTELLTFLQINKKKKTEISHGPKYSDPLLSI